MVTEVALAGGVDLRQGEEGDPRLVGEEDLRQVEEGDPHPIEKVGLLSEDHLNGMGLPVHNHPRPDLTAVGLMTFLLMRSWDLRWEEAVILHTLEMGHRQGEGVGHRLLEVNTPGVLGVGEDHHLVDIAAELDSTRGMQTVAL